MVTWSSAPPGPRVGRSSVAYMGRWHGTFEGHCRVAAGLRRPPRGAGGESPRSPGGPRRLPPAAGGGHRSEEQKAEPQSRPQLVFPFFPVKKKNTRYSAPHRLNE